MREGEDFTAAGNLVVLKTTGVEPRCDCFILDASGHQDVAGFDDPVLVKLG